MEEFKKFTGDIIRLEFLKNEEKTQKLKLENWNEYETESEGYLNIVFKDQSNEIELVLLFAYDESYVVYVQRKEEANKESSIEEQTK